MPSASAWSLPHHVLITLGGGKSIRLCFVSRVEQSKGLDTLKTIAELLAKEHLTEQVKIDFYGQKKDTYFDDHLQDIKIYKYKGVLQPNEVISTLRQYAALIFPTHYPGEGCPGILVEALIASIPIIASDWKYNSEFVNDGDNGFLCDTLSAQTYVAAIKALLSNKALRRRMAARSYDCSRNFSADRAKQMIAEYI